MKTLFPSLIKFFTGSISRLTRFAPDGQALTQDPQAIHLPPMTEAESSFILIAFT
jgi:hypothetical protein